MTSTRQTPTVFGGAIVTAALAFLRRRRRRLHSSAAELHDTLLPEGVDEPTGDVEPSNPEGHAPGHRHLPPPPADRTVVGRGAPRRRYFTGNRSRLSRS